MSQVPIRLHTLAPARGAKHRRKIVGRGEGSGHGQTATRGMKGQRARSGEGKRPGFEGGQTPLVRRIPKRGFSHAAFRETFQIVNIKTLAERFKSGAEVTPESIRQARLVKRGGPIKVLGEGDISFPLQIRAHAFSESAEKKITGAGGKVEKVSA